MWSVAFHDLLAEHIGVRLQPGERVLYACEAPYGPCPIVRSLSRASGCIEGLLIDLNAIQDGGAVHWIAPRAWQRTSFDGWKPTGNAAQRRAQRKAASVAKVNELYALDTTDDNLSEAILQNDYVVMHRREWWRV